MINIVPLEYRHISEIKPYLCANSLREIKAISAIGFDADKELNSCYFDKVFGYAAIKDNVPFWIVLINGDKFNKNKALTTTLTGKFDMLSSAESMQIIRFSRKLFNMALDKFSHIEGYILNDNEYMHKWLRLAGAIFGDVINLGGESFHKFRLERA